MASRVNMCANVDLPSSQREPNVAILIGLSFDKIMADTSLSLYAYRQHHVQSRFFYNLREFYKSTLE